MIESPLALALARAVTATRRNKNAVAPSVQDGSHATSAARGGGGGRGAYGWVDGDLPVGSSFDTFSGGGFVISWIWTRILMLGTRDLYLEQLCAFVTVVADGGVYH